MRISNAKLLNILLKDVFGSITLNLEKWEGLSNARFSIGRTYFNDRFKQPIPLNRAASEKLQALYRHALTDGSGCGYDAKKISRNLCDVLESLIPGENFRHLIFLFSDTENVRSTKTEGLLSILSLLLSLAESEQTPNLVKFREFYSQELKYEILKGLALPSSFLAEEHTIASITHENSQTDASSSEKKSEVFSESMHYLPGNKNTAAEDVHIVSETKIKEKGSTFIQKRIPSLDNMHFHGRKQPLAKLYEILSEKGQCLISGMGGIGKSELVRKFIENHRDNFQEILWLPYESSLSQTLADDRKLQIRCMARADYSFEDEIAYAERKLQKLREEATEQTLVVLDNFDVEDDPMLDEFLEGSHSLIITSRITRNLRGRLPEICLSELEDHEILNVFECYYIDAGGVQTHTEIVSDDAIHEIIFNCLHKHTYSVILAASLLATERVEGKLLTPKNLLASLKNNVASRIRFFPIEEKHSDELTIIHDKILSNLSIMFRLSSLTEDEIYFLKNLSLVSIGGISVSDICFLCKFSEVNGYSTIIRKLIQRNWVLYDRERDYVSLHVLVQKLLLDSITNNEHTFDAFAETIWKIWETEMENISSAEWEKTFQWATRAATVLPLKHRQKYNFEKTEIFLLSYFKYQEAQKRLSQLHSPNRIEDLFILSRRAELLLWTGDFQTAYDLIKKPYDQIKSISLEDWPDDCCLAYLYIIDKALAVFLDLGKYNESLEANSLLLRVLESNISISTHWDESRANYRFALAYLRMGDLQKAKMYAEKLSVWVDRDKPTQLGIFYRLQAMLSFAEGKDSDAFKAVEKAHHQCILHLPEQHMDFAVLYIISGDLFLRQKILAKAREEYEKAKKIIEFHQNPYYLGLISRRIRCSEEGCPPPQSDFLTP